MINQMINQSVNHSIVHRMIEKMIYYYSITWSIQLSSFNSNTMWKVWCYMIDGNISFSPPFNHSLVIESLMGSFNRPFVSVSGCINHVNYSRIGWSLSTSPFKSYDHSILLSNIIQYSYWSYQIRLLSLINLLYELCTNMPKQRISHSFIQTVVQMVNRSNVLNDVKDSSNAASFLIWSVEWFGVQQFN